MASYQRESGVDASVDSGVDSGVDSHDGQRMPTVAELGRAVGDEIASLVLSSADTGATITGSVLYDAAGRSESGSPPRFPGALALAVGLPIADDHIAERFQELHTAGFLALVYKAHGAQETTLHRAAEASGIALFRARDSVPWDQLAELFRAAIAPQDASRRALVDIRPGDLFELANAVASLAGGAVAIADPDQTVLAYSTLPEHPIDETRRTSILHLQVPHTDQNDRDYRRVHASRDVVSVAPGEYSLTRSAMAIRAGSVVLGSLWLIDASGAGSGSADSGSTGSSSADTADTDRILREAANVAALHLLHRRTNHDSGRSRQIDLVRPLLFEAGRAELAAVQLGLPTDPVRVVAVAAAGQHGSAPDILQAGLRLFDSVRTACAVWLPTAACGLADNIVYVVLPQSSNSTAAFQFNAMRRIVQHTRRLLSRPVLAGFGLAVPVGDAGKSRADAEVVLAVLLRDAEEGLLHPDSDADAAVADQDSMGPRLQLGRIVTELRQAGQLPGDYATRIAEHDVRRKTSFEETIRTYLDASANAIETATRLRLHPNTVRYRLSRVEPLFGLRLDDPETRLLLWLQLWARQH